MIKLKSCRILRYLSRVSLYIGVAKLFTVIFVLVCRNLSNLRAEFLKPVLAIIETSRTPIFSCFCPPTTWSAHCYGKLAVTHPSRKNPTSWVLFLVPTLDQVSLGFLDVISFFGGFRSQAFDPVILIGTVGRKKWKNSCTAIRLWV